MSLNKSYLASLGCAVLIAVGLGCGAQGGAATDGGPRDGNPLVDSRLVEAEGGTTDGAAADGGASDAALADQTLPVDSGPNPSDGSSSPEQGLADAQPVVDAPRTDGQPPASHRVLFAHGPVEKKNTFATIETSGNNYQPIGNLGFVYLDPVSMTLEGRLTDYIDPAANGPRVLTQLAYGPLQLPRNLGVLRWFGQPDSTGIVKTIGIMRLRPDAQLELLYAMPRTGTAYKLAQDLSTNVAVSDDGRFVAAARQLQRGIVLMRADGTRYGAGKTYLEVAVTPTPDAIAAQSLTFVGHRLYFISTKGDLSTLWSMPADGSQPEKAVVLPQVAGKAPSWIDPQLESNNSGKLVVIAGSSSTNEDLLVLDPNGSSRNLTKAPTALGSRGEGYGRPGNVTTQLRLSPSGSYVAYTKLLSFNQVELWIAPTDGSSAARHLTEASNVSSNAFWRYVHHLRFIDDSSLLFVMGSSTVRGDLYRYDRPSQTLTNLTKNGGTSKPFALDSAVDVFGLWRSANGRYLYYFEDPSQTIADPRRDLKAIDLLSNTVVSITKNAKLDATQRGIAGCQSKTVVLVGDPVARASATQHQLLIFDQDQATAAKPLTQLKPSGDMLIEALALAANCSTVLLSAGAASDAMEVYGGPLGAPSAIKRLSPTLAGAKQLVSSYLSVASSGDVGVFAAGPSVTTMNVFAANLLHPAAAQQIFTTAAAIRIYATH